MAPGSFNVSRALSALFKTIICWPTLNGSPSGWPSGHLRNIALGDLASSVNLLTMDTAIVGTPFSSIALCISPTDRLQRPHPGVRMTASTPAFLIFPATSGAVFSTRVPRCLPSIWPMKP